jgi:hypothetical protein
VRLRRLNPAGLARFAELLPKVDGSAGRFGLELAADEALTEVLGDTEVEPDALDGKSRLDAAAYLDARLSSVSDPEQDAGLWAWLSLVFFDAVCPRDAKGRYGPGSALRYIPRLDDARRAHRHRLLGPYVIFRLHRQDPYRALCVLCQPLVRPGRLVERLASRPRLVASPASITVATILYCDGERSIRRGAAANVERLSEVLSQLDRTYDVFGMTADALLKLLPPEFDPFRRRPKR